MGARVTWVTPEKSVTGASISGTLPQTRTALKWLNARWNLAAPRYRSLTASETAVIWGMRAMRKFAWLIAPYICRHTRHSHSFEGFSVNASCWARESVPVADATVWSDGTSVSIGQPRWKYAWLEPPVYQSSIPPNAILRSASLAGKLSGVKKSS